MHIVAFLAETADEAAKGPFPAFDTAWYASQLFWLFVFFTVLYLALSRFVLPKLSDTIEKRSNRIAADLDEAARLHAQSADSKHARDQRMAQARVKARETADTARQKAEAELASETSRADLELEKKLEAAEIRIAKLRASALKNVEQIAVDAAEAMVGRLGVKASPADLKKAVSAALEQ